MTALNIGVLGCAGRMGQEVCRQVLSSEELNLSAGVVSPQSRFVGADIGLILHRSEIGLKAIGDATEAIKNADVLIEFTSPLATMSYVHLAARYQKPILVGTTGLNDEQKQQIFKISKEIPLLLAANTSLGANLLSYLTELVAKTLDERFDIEISEKHHRLKKDAPSGTAIALGEAAARGRSTKLSQVAKYYRFGDAGVRKEGEIGFCVSRGGRIVGEHSVSFLGDVEEITLSHTCSDRRVFASGAVSAACWLTNQKAGFYTMRDVLNLNF